MSRLLQVLSAVMGHPSDALTPGSPPVPWEVTEVNTLPNEGAGPLCDFRCRLSTGHAGAPESAFSATSSGLRGTSVPSVSPENMLSYRNGPSAEIGAVTASATSSLAPMPALQGAADPISQMRRLR